MVMLNLMNITVVSSCSHLRHSWYKQLFSHLLLLSFPLHLNFVLSLVLLKNRLKAPKLETPSINLVTTSVIIDLKAIAFFMSSRSTWYITSCYYRNVDLMMQQAFQRKNPKYPSTVFKNPHSIFIFSRWSVKPHTHRRIKERA